MTYNTSNRGVTLLITMLVTSVLVGISASLLNVTLKQYRLAGIARDSEMAFQAANAGMECMVYQDTLPSGVSIFDVNGDGTTVPEEATVECMTDTSSEIADVDATVVSGEAQQYQFSWGTPEVCSDVTLTKFYEEGTYDGDTDGPNMQAALESSTPVLCSEDAICTVVKSRGYSVGCSDIGNARTIERELTQRY